MYLISLSLWFASDMHFLSCPNFLYLRSPPYSAPLSNLNLAAPLLQIATHAQP
ncbi:hypothetical protein LguiB_026303 [Lonicera macranthoides]